MKRRDFLKQTLAGTIGMGLATPASILGQFTLARSAMAASQTNFTDHKALVCIYLAGGNDSLNMVIPRDSVYSTYANAKKSLAVAKSDLLALNPLRSNTYAVGLNGTKLNGEPILGKMQNLFNNKGHLGIVANVGTLLRPTEKNDIGNLAMLPPQLFSHNDQTAHWMRGSFKLDTSTGWAGRMADMVADTQSQTSMNFSISGTNLLQIGENSVPFALGTDGVIDFNALKGAALRRKTFERLNQQAMAMNNPLVAEYAKSTGRIQENVTFVKSILDAAPASGIAIPDNNPLAAQLSYVAQLISQHKALGQSRQSFFVKLGGWDTHDNQLDEHPALLQQLDEALWYFYRRLIELKKLDAVTTFTMSEFGRTLTSNGDGTDHGWGGHHLVMGGAVNGKNIYGTLPDLTPNGTNDFGDGRIIPTTSADQMNATLLRWFGLTNNQVKEIFPNLANFNSYNLGFMNI